MLGASGYATKKQLKAAVLKPNCTCQSKPLTIGAVINTHSIDRHRLRFVETSMFGAEFKPDGTNVVVGPDAYRKRSWYAQVECKDGIIVKVT